jgi:hypothetical protein
MPAFLVEEERRVLAGLRGPSGEVLRVIALLPHRSPPYAKIIPLGGPIDIKRNA